MLFSFSYFLFIFYLIIFENKASIQSLDLMWLWVLFSEYCRVFKTCVMISDIDTLSVLLVYCAGNPPIAGGFPALSASDAENLFPSIVSMGKLLSKESSFSWNDKIPSQTLSNCLLLCAENPFLRLHRHTDGKKYMYVDIVLTHNHLMKCLLRVDCAHRITFTRSRDSCEYKSIQPPSLSHAWD